MPIYGSKRVRIQHELLRWEIPSDFYRGRLLRVHSVSTPFF